MSGDLIVKEEPPHAAGRLRIPHRWDSETASVEENRGCSGRTEASVTGVSWGSRDGRRLKCQDQSQEARTVSMERHVGGKALGHQRGCHAIVLFGPKVFIVALEDLRSHSF